jgi:hypothetical protein
VKQKRSQSCFSGHRLLRLRPASTRPTLDRFASGAAMRRSLPLALFLLAVKHQKEPIRLELSEAHAVRRPGPHQVVRNIAPLQPPPVAGSAVGNDN